MFTKCNCSFTDKLENECPSYHPGRSKWVANMCKFNLPSFFQLPVHSASSPQFFTHSFQHFLSHTIQCIDVLAIYGEYRKDLDLLSF